MSADVSCPEWANKELSDALPRIRSRGEGSRLEFKSAFPKQARDLGKEIAAFASRGGGVVVLGVADDGTCVGLDGCDSPSGRDETLRRLEGVFRGVVSPPLNPTVSFAVEDGRVCVVLEIPKGAQPIYYCNGIPYVRSLTESRPATPDEVIEEIRTWLGHSYREAREPEGDSAKYDRICNLVVDMHTDADLLRDRALNPWLEEFGSHCEWWAKDLREIVRDDLGAEPVLAEQVGALVERCDSISLEWRRLHHGSDIKGMVTAFLDEVDAIKKRTVDEATLSDAATEHVVREIRSRAGQLADLSSIAKKRRGLRISDTQADAAEIGADIMRLTAFPLSFMDLASLEALRRAARDLALVDTIQIYMDGGASVARVQQAIDVGASAVAAAANTMAG